MTTIELWHVEKDAELLAEIGKVTVRWGALDLLLAGLLSTLLQDPSVGHKLIFVSCRGGWQRLTKFKATVEDLELDERVKTDLLDLTREFLDLLDERNAIVHSPLVTSYKVDGKKIGLRVERLNKNGLKTSVTVDAIRAHADELGGRLALLEAIFLDIGLQMLPEPNEGYHEPQFLNENDPIPDSDG
jgi:hypothetical protein